MVFSDPSQDTVLFMPGKFLTVSLCRHCFV